jgi:hypothetical protein
MLSAGIDCGAWGLNDDETHWAFEVGDVDHYAI